MLIEILTFSFIKMRLKVSSAKWRPFCLGLNVLMMSIVPSDGMVLLGARASADTVLSDDPHQYLYTYTVPASE